jgi:VanZ family protein
MKLQESTNLARPFGNRREPMRPLKLKILWHTIGWTYLAFVIYASLTPSPPDLPGFPGADKWLHLIAYTMMMLWFGFLYRSRLSLLVLGASFIALGIVLDLLQGATSFRSMEFLDMMANALGVLIGGLLARTRIGLALSRLERLIFEGPG